MEQESNEETLSDEEKETRETLKRDAQMAADTQDFIRRFADPEQRKEMDAREIAEGAMLFSLSTTHAIMNCIERAESVSAGNSARIDAVANFLISPKEKQQYIIGKAEEERKKAAKPGSGSESGKMTALEAVASASMGKTPQGVETVKPVGQ